MVGEDSCEKPNLIKPETGSTVQVVPALCSEVEFFCHWSLHASVQEDMEDMVDVIEKLEAKYDTKYKSVRSVFAQDSL